MLRCKTSPVCGRRLARQCRSQAAAHRLGTPDPGHAIGEFRQRLQPEQRQQQIGPGFASATLSQPTPGLSITPGRQVSAGMSASPMARPYESGQISGITAETSTPVVMFSGIPTRRKSVKR